MKIYIEKSHIDLVVAMDFEKEFMHAIKQTLEARKPVNVVDFIYVSKRSEVVSSYILLEKLGVFISHNELCTRSDEEKAEGLQDYYYKASIPACVKGWIEFAETNKKVKAAIDRKAGK